MNKIINGLMIPTYSNLSVMMIILGLFLHDIGYEIENSFLLTTAIIIYALGLFGFGTKKNEK